MSAILSRPQCVKDMGETVGEQTTKQHSKTQAVYISILHERHWIYVDESAHVDYVRVVLLLIILIIVTYGQFRPYN